MLILITYFLKTGVMCVLFLHLQHVSFSVHKGKIFVQYESKILSYLCRIILCKTHNFAMGQRKVFFHFIGFQKFVKGICCKLIFKYLQGFGNFTVLNA